MKRFFLRLIPRRFKTSYTDAISYVLGVITAILVGVLIFTLVDMTPATALDYKPLEEQAARLENNPKMLMTTDYTLYSNNGLLTVTFENDECKLIAKYDSELNLLEVAKKDKCFSLLLTLVVAIVLSAGAYAYGHVLFFFIFSLFEVLWKKIFKANKHEKVNS